MDGAPTWMLSWIVVVAIGLSPVLVIFIGIVLRRKLVVHQRSGGCPPAEMTEEDEAGTSRSAKLRSTDASLGVTLSPWVTRATSGRRQSGSQRTLRRRRSSHNWKATVLEPSLIGRVLTRRMLRRTIHLAP